MLVSSKGYGLFVPTGSPAIFSDVPTSDSYFMTEADEQLNYFFLYGPSFDEIIGSYRSLTGKATCCPHLISMMHFATRHVTVTGSRHSRGWGNMVSMHGGAIPDIYSCAGSILPMAAKDICFADELQQAGIRMHVYPGADCTYELYEDTGDGYDYEQGAYSIRRFAWNDEKQELTQEACEWKSWMSEIIQICVH